MRSLMVLAFVLILLPLGLMTYGFPIRSGQDSPLPSYAKEFNINTSQFEFQPYQIKVKRGTTIKIIVKNLDTVDHGLTIPELGLTALRTTARKAVLEFTPQEPGSYQFRCNVQCGLSHDRMVGTLIVE